ncbi:MAG: gamma carbonic anhydrase family protein [Pirellulaceae bacterium]|nr:gamma carbonic anhydrase family protein [Pirellulaceae bacterium]
MVFVFSGDRQTLVRQSLQVAERMMAHNFERLPEQVASDAFVASTATVIGDVTIGSQASVWFGAVIRGDVERIQIGACSNIQDLAVLHADPGLPCVIGQRVTVGHAAIVHGAVVEDDALIGIRATVLNGARIGSGSLIGAGALVTEGTEIPPGKLVLGVPARVVRDLNADDRERLQRTWENYVRAAQAARGLSAVKPNV